MNRPRSSVTVAVTFTSSMPLVKRKPSCAEPVASAAATNPAAMTRRFRHRDRMRPMRARLPRPVIGWRPGRGAGPRAAAVLKHRGTGWCSGSPRSSTAPTPRRARGRAVRLASSATGAPPLAMACPCRSSVTSSTARPRTGRPAGTATSPDTVNASAVTPCSSRASSRGLQVACRRPWRGRVPEPGAGQDRHHRGRAERHQRWRRAQGLIRLGRRPACDRSARGRRRTRRRWHAPRRARRDAARPSPSTREQRGEALATLAPGRGTGLRGVNRRRERRDAVRGLPARRANGLPGNGGTHGCGHDCRDRHEGRSELEKCGHRRLKDTTASTVTATGVPSRLAGANCHSRTAATARSSSPAPRPRTQAHVPDASVGFDDDRQHDLARDAQASRVFGIHRLHLTQQARRADATAAAVAGAAFARPRSLTDAGPLRVADAAGLAGAGAVGERGIPRRPVERFFRAHTAGRGRHAAEDGRRKRRGLERRGLGHRRYLGWGLRTRTRLRPRPGGRAAASAAAGAGIDHEHQPGANRRFFHRRVHPRPARPQQQPRSHDVDASRGHASQPSGLAAFRACLPHRRKAERLAFIMVEQPPPDGHGIPAADEGGARHHRQPAAVHERLQRRRGCPRRLGQLIERKHVRGDIWKDDIHGSDHSQRQKPCLCRIVRNRPTSRHRRVLGVGSVTCRGRSRPQALRELQPFTVTQGAHGEEPGVLQRRGGASRLVERGLGRRRPPEKTGQPRLCRPPR